jgi:hypothetical protein
MSPPVFSTARKAMRPSLPHPDGASAWEEAAVLANIDSNICDTFTIVRWVDVLF